MNVVNKPDSLSLTGNINPIVVATTKELTFVLKKGSEQILSQSFNPGTSGSVTIKIGDILNNQLGFTLKEATSYYLQNSIFATFTATLTDSDGSTDITFVAVRCGVNQLGDTPSEFLKYNFLTWQPTVKKVTYYTPEYLSYYAVVPGKLQIKATYQDATSETKTIVSMDAGTAVTVPLQYGTVYGIFGKLPAFYDVWYEDASGNVLSYVQRYVADNAKSENEQWILFTNSLGGVDTFRAYGEEEFTGEHTHNLVEIDDTNEEYRVDTVSKHKKYTGHLTKYERRWMQDFFPSLNKFIYSNGEARKIVIIESEDTYNDLDQAGGFSFTYKYTETDAYLNLQRNTQLPKDINIDVPDLANFTLPPRLLEFPTLSGSEGVLFPAQKTYADKWGKISLDDIIQFTIDSLLVSDIAKKWTATSNSSHSHENKSVLDTITKELIDKWNSTNGNSHSHDNKSFLDQIDQNLSTKDSPTFESLKIGTGVIKWDSTHKSFYIEQTDGTTANFYATGGVSSYGAASGSGSGSGIDEATLWSIMGNTGTQQIAANHLATALSPYVTQSAMSAALINYAPINHGHVWGDITDRPASLPASDVYAWAKAITKPNYSFLEITDKPSTLGGYGITDAAAKSHSHVWADITDRPTKLGQFTNDIISAWALAASKPSYSYAEISGTPDLSSLHTHSNKDLLDAINQNLSSTGRPIFSKITIGAISLAFDSANNSLYVQKSDGTSANFYATGGVSSYGAGASSGSGSGIDETTLWSIMGNTGTQQIAANHLATALSLYITQTSLSATLANYAPLVHGHVWGDITDRPSSLPASDVYAWAKAATKPSYSYSEITDKPTSLPASDVYAWAKAATKPSYAFSEITDKPSTLGGYGITDAASAASLANYLPLAGGIMTGPLIIQPNQRQIIFRPQSSWYGSLGYDTTGGECFGIMFQNVVTKFKVKAGYDSSTFAGGGAYTNMYDADLEIGAGYGKIAGYTIWHAGNDGSGSGLDADMLDGRHYYQYVYDIGGNYSGKIYDLPSKTVFSGSDLADAPVSGWVSGLTLALNWNDNHYQTYLVSSGGNRWFSGNYSNPIAWKEFAFLTDNVASATKLYTPRSFTIGNTAKSFDGTGNVSWSLSEIGAAAAIHSHTISQITDIGNASVNYAASASNADTLDGFHESSFLRYRGALLDGKNALSGVQTTGFYSSSTNYQTTWGDSLHIQGFSSWYNRLDFGTDGRIYFYQAINPDSTTGCMTYKGTLAYLSDNVASATKLQTARSIFGQSFDGTGDVNGDASIMGTLNIITGGDNKIILNNTDGEKYQRISYREGGTQYAEILCNSNGFFFYHSLSSSMYLNGYNIYHSGNSNISSTDWSCRDLYVYGPHGVVANNSFVNNIASGSVGGWARGYTWESSDLSTLIGGTYMYGTNLSPNWINIAFGGYDSTTGICILPNGNVGIGITSPAYKLHVSGTGYFSDSLNLAATMTAAGLITANGNVKAANYIEIGSTGIRIMYDSTNDCLKLIKSDGSAVNLLVTGGVTALATA